MMNPKELYKDFLKLIDEVQYGWDFVEDITPEEDEHGSYFDCAITKHSICFFIYIERDGDANKVVNIDFNKECTIGFTEIPKETITELLKLIGKNFPLMPYKKQLDIKMWMEWMEDTEAWYLPPGDEVIKHPDFQKLLELLEDYFMEEILSEKDKMEYSVKDRNKNLIIPVTIFGVKSYLFYKYAGQTPVGTIVNLRQLWCVSTGTPKLYRDALMKFMCDGTERLLSVSFVHKFDQISNKELQELNFPDLFEEYKI